MWHRNLNTTLLSCVWLIFSSFVHLPILSNPAPAVRVVSAYSAGEISEATKGHAILLRIFQYSCSVFQSGGAGKTSETCNGPAIKFDLLILLSDPACSAGEIVRLKRSRFWKWPVMPFRKGCVPHYAKQCGCFFFLSFPKYPCQLI